jgi:polysaccharide pyruvyl transferase WcaK-like protein
MLIIGGGNLLMDLFDENVRIIEAVCQAAMKAKVPYAFLGVGAGPIRSLDSQRRLGACLAGAAAVFVRDSESLALCRDILGRTDALKVADPAFAWPGLAASTMNDGGTIALNVASIGDRTWPWIDEVMYQAYVRGFVRLVRAAVRQFNAKRLILVATNIRVDCRATEQVAAELEREMGEIDVSVALVPCADVTDALTAFSRANVAITTRLHAGIIAANSGCRVLPIAYDPKVRAVLKDEGVSANAIDLHALIDVAWSPERYLDCLANSNPASQPDRTESVISAIETLLRGLH